MHEYMIVNTPWTGIKLGVYGLQEETPELSVRKRTKKKTKPGQQSGSIQESPVYSRIYNKTSEI